MFEYQTNFLKKTFILTVLIAMSIQVQLVTLQQSELQQLVRDAAREAVEMFRNSLPIPQEVFTAEEAATFLRFISKDGSPNFRAIHQLKKLGKLKAVEDDGIVRFTRKALYNYLNEYESYSVIKRR